MSMEARHRATHHSSSSSAVNIGGRSHSPSSHSASGVLLRGRHVKATHALAQGWLRSPVLLVLLSLLLGTFTAVILLETLFHVKILSAGFFDSTDNFATHPENCELRLLDAKKTPHHAAIQESAQDWRVAFLLGTDVLPLSHAEKCRPVIEDAPSMGAVVVQEDAPSCGSATTPSKSKPIALSGGDVLKTRFLAVLSNDDDVDDERPVQRWHLRLRLPCGLPGEEHAKEAKLDVVVHRAKGAVPPLGSQAAADVKSSLLEATDKAWGSRGTATTQERRRAGAAALAAAANSAGKLPALQLSPGNWGVDVQSMDDVALEVRAFALRGSVRLAQEVAVHAAGLAASGVLDFDDNAGSDAARASVYVRCTPDSAPMVLASLAYAARAGGAAASVLQAGVDEAIFVSITATVALSGSTSASASGMDRVAIATQQAVLQASAAVQSKNGACSGQAQADGTGLQSGPAFMPVTVAVWCAGMEGANHAVVVDVTSLDAPPEPGTGEAFVQQIAARYDANQVAYIARFLRPEGRYLVSTTVDGVVSQSPHRAKGESPTTAALASATTAAAAPKPKRASTTPRPAVPTTTASTRPMSAGMLAAMRDGAAPEGEVAHLSGHSALNAAASEASGPPGYASARRRQADKAVKLEQGRAHAAAKLAYDQITGGTRGDGGALISQSRKRVRRLPPNGMRGEALGSTGAPQVESIEPQLNALADEEARVASFARMFTPHGTPGISGKSGVMNLDDFEIPGMTPAGAAPRMIGARLIGKHKLGREAIHLSMSSGGYVSDPPIDTRLMATGKDAADSSSDEETAWKKLTEN